MTGLVALGPFVALVSFFQGIRERRDDRVRAALSVLAKALVETRLYLRDRQQGAKRASKRQDELARLWADAAAALYALDSRLAQVCQHKSDYWMQPDEWSEHKVDQKGIAIERLFETYGLLLKARDSKLDPGIN